MKTSPSLRRAGRVREGNSTNMVKLEQEPDYCTCCFVIMSVVLLLNQPYVTLDVSSDHKRVSG